MKLVNGDRILISISGGGEARLRNEKLGSWNIDASSAKCAADGCGFSIECETVEKYALEEHAQTHAT